ncbi:MAG: DUF1990 domain-containing protein [Planctomycetota bacterium]
MFLLRNPTADDVHHFLSSQRNESLTYEPVGSTRPTHWWQRNASELASFNLDRDSVVVGTGEATFHSAMDGIRQWKMFPECFASLFWPSVEPEVGAVVVAGFQLSRLGKLWSLNPCRIVYTIDETLTINDTQLHRYGFGYGTLPGHVAKGEERFLVTWDTSTDEVRYEVSSYSWPNSFVTRLGYPVVRWMQKRFRSLSCQAMKEHCIETSFTVGQFKERSNADPAITF